MRALLSRIVLIRIGGEEYIPPLPEKAREICGKHHLQFPYSEEEENQGHMEENK